MRPLRWVSGVAGAALAAPLASYSPSICTARREKKGESPAELRRRYWQQWQLGDPLKRPTRALFCRLALTLLRHAGGGAAADALLLQQLLQLRPMMGGVLNSLAADPPAEQLQVGDGSARERAHVRPCSAHTQGC